jgi:hypothetical protein
LDCPFRALTIVLAGSNALWAAALGQALFGAATAMLMAILTARATGQRRVGLAAGGIAIVHPTLRKWAARATDEV